MFKTMSSLQIFKPTSLVDFGYREMTELTFLRYGAKYQNV